MNILLLTNTLYMDSGWGKQTEPFINFCTKKELEVFTSDNRKKLIFGKNNLKSIYFPKLGYVALIFDLINVLIFLRKKPNIVHANVEFYAPLAMILAFLFRVPYSITAAGTYSISLPYKYKIYKFAFQKADRIISVSNYTKKRIFDEFNFDNVCVVNQGVNLKIFKKSKFVLKENIITFVGNLKPRKGLLFLLESLAILQNRGCKYELFVIGKIEKDHYFKNVMRIIKENKLNVSFKGKLPIENLVNYYQKAKVNVLPSLSKRFNFEGFGLIHNEANACGTLSIGTFNSGNEDAIKNKKYLVKYGDKDHLANLLEELLESKNYEDLVHQNIKSQKEYKEDYLNIWNDLIKNFDN
tara:strand:+ start:700 stop:1761 length:1062 start_codon:yes stop_codon:yes gene_type:complete